MISFYLAVACQAVILNHGHWCFVISSSGKSQETVRADVFRQRAQSLEFRSREESVALLPQRPLSSAVNTHNPQPFIIICQARGIGWLAIRGNTGPDTVVSKVILS